MRQAMLVGPRRLEIVDVTVPDLDPSEVLVRVLAAGACASELPVWQAGEGAPCRLGHELAGRVEAVGQEVRAFAPGDLVTGLAEGCFAEQVITTADRLIAIPAGIAVEHAHGEPISCAVSAARRMRVELGDRVAIVGCGYMGLLLLQLLRLMGATEITVVEPRAEARTRALALGADRVLHPDEVGPESRIVMPVAPGETRGFDAVVEATGTQAGLTLAGELARLHGMLAILGYHQEGPRSVDMQLWNFKALEVLNAHERRIDHQMDCMRRGLALLAAGRLDTATLTTHRFTLDRVGEAYAMLEEKPRGFVKAVVVTGAS